MRIKLSLSLNISRDLDEGGLDRETDVYTAHELQTPSDIPTSMRPIGFIPDDPEEWRS